MQADPYIISSLIFHSYTGDQGFVCRFRCDLFYRIAMLFKKTFVPKSDVMQ